MALGCGLNLRAARLPALSHCACFDVDTSSRLVAMKRDWMTRFPEGMHAATTLVAAPEGFASRAWCEIILPCVASVSSLSVPPAEVL